ncbi:MAG: membrane protein insertion efficiency factor YidD [Patescibacteria group bacterium]|nr:membrane protein insertion efficiency factor YidD [Patescibacteria group bacterium]
MRSSQNLENINSLIRLPAKALAALIVAYQRSLSPDHGWLRAKHPYGYCRHYPSCSEYSRQSLVKYGLVKGLFLSTKRIARCHPWAEPSVDPVP